MMIVAMAALIGLAVPAEAEARPAVIRVIGRGTVKTAPDLATISFSVRGEGRSSDEAVRALTERQAAIEKALAGAAEVRTGRLSVAAVRDAACVGDDDDDDRPRLSVGACAIKGYVATLGATARVTAVNEAGTLLATASGLGATEPSLGDFALSRPATAQQAALAAAVRDAQLQAEAIAAASQLALGPIRRVEDQRSGGDRMDDIIVTAELATRVPVTRVQVRLTPAPIETEATVIVEFALGGERRPR